MPGRPVFAGFAFLGLGLVYLVIALRRGATHLAAWTDAAGNTNPGGAWHLASSILFTACGLFSLWHQL